MTVLGATISQLRVQDFREFVCDGLILGVHKLGHQDLGKEASEVIELDGELSKPLVRDLPGLKAIQIRIVNGTMVQDVVPHLVIE